MSALRFGLLALALIGLLTSGCVTPTKIDPADTVPEVQVMRSGDKIRIRFQGSQAQNLDIEQTINMDGKVNLTLGGEIVAAGKTPKAFEDAILQLIGDQLQPGNREVRVTVVEASYFVFVTGAVMNPGKITPTRVVTAFEAIQEAGGFDHTKANKKAVKVVRLLEGGVTKNYVIDIQALIDGTSQQPFYLKNGDSVVVEEKFSWF